MNMKAAVAMLLLALLLVTATTVVNADHGGHHRHRGHRGGGSDENDDEGHRRSSPLAGLTQCVTICGSGVTACMLDCYQPLIDVDPVELPVCLLKCTNDAMVCASGCRVAAGNNV